MSKNPDTPEPKRSETDPPAANQPVGEGVEDDEEAGRPKPISQTIVGEPAPTAVPVVAPHGGQVAPGKPDGEVDSRT